MRGNLLTPAGVDGEISFFEKINAYTPKDKIYRIAAITTTTRRFGPSGSLINRNITREHTRDVIPNTANEVFFKLNMG